LLVLFEHWSGLRKWFPIGAGTLGVGLFFTLSGFLITGILLEDLDRRASPGPVLRGFYIRRIFRLAPAYYAVLMALAVLGIGGIAASWPWHAAYLSNFYMAAGGTENVFWTLSVEEQFYLVWPLVLVVTPRRWLLTVAASTLPLALAFKLASLAFGYWPSFYLLPWQADLLGFGGLLAILSFHQGRRNSFHWFTGKRIVAFSTLAFLCLAVAILDWAVHGAGITRLLFMNPLCAVFFGWLILMTAAGRWPGWLAPLFDSAVLQYVGRISYGIYLVHNWLPAIVEKFAGPLPKYLAAPIVVVLTFAICALSWRFFEQPLIRLGRRISDAVEARRARTLASEAKS
jgi:peptidoglycan/LPS O-acetylase OafA/YrhL